jgi:hypothetical protein
MSHRSASCFLALLSCCLGSSAWAQKAVSVGPAVSLSPHLVGFNNQAAAIGEPWDVDTRREGFLRTRARLIRYPGGTVSTYWDMRQDRMFTLGDLVSAPDGVVLQRKYVISWVALMNGGQVNSLKNLKHLIEDAREKDPDGPPTVLFVLNMVTPGADYYASVWQREVDQTPGTSDWWAMMDDRLARNLDMLDRAVELGIPVRYVEFGNEYYFGQGAANPEGAVVEPYVAGVTPPDPQMTGAFPDADSKIDADSDPDYGRAYSCAVNEWAPKLLARYPGVRLAAVASDGRGGARRRDWNYHVARHVDRSLVPAVSFHHYGGISRGSLTTTAEAFHEALRSWKDSRDEILNFADEVRDREFWITEWNSNSAPGTWGHGLQSLFALKTWLEQGNVALTTYHQFSATPILRASGPEITAGARALSLFALASAGRARAQEVRWADNPPGAPDSALPRVWGWRFTRTDSTCARYLIGNYSTDAASLDLKGLFGEHPYRAHVAHAALGTSTNDPGEKTLSVSGALELPPLSVAVLYADQADGARCLEGCVPAASGSRE